jgi:hypothetical protein
VARQRMGPKEAARPAQATVRPACARAASWREERKAAYTGLVVSSSLAAVAAEPQSSDGRAGRLGKRDAPKLVDADEKNGSHAASAGACSRRRRASQESKHSHVRHHPSYARAAGRPADRQRVKSVLGRPANQYN